MIESCVGLACAAGATSAPRMRARMNVRMVVDMKLLPARGFEEGNHGGGLVPPAVS